MVIIAIIMITLTVKMDEDDDDRINCHQSCSALEMMVATNLGGSELVNKYIRSWMEAQENSGNPNIHYYMIMLTPHTLTWEEILSEYIKYVLFPLTKMVGPVN